MALCAAAALFAVALAAGLLRYFGSAPRNAIITSSPSPRFECRVNLNTADIPRLRLLPGIGPVTAKAIVEHRSRRGPFEKLSDLREVHGVGQGKIDAIRPYVTLCDE